RAFVRKSRSVLFCLLVFLVPSIVQAQKAMEESENKTGSSLPSLTATKECLKEARSAECVDNLFREALKGHRTADVLQVIQRCETEVPEGRRDGHPGVHAVGREAFRLKGNIHASFSACDQTCHSGCYHGAVERFLRGDDIYSETYRHPSQAE